MPTYDYKCNACGHAFEQFQSMKDKVLRTCPNCGKKSLERLIGTGAAIVFKGSGFYQTDYRSENYKKAKEADSKPATSESKPSESSTSASKPSEPSEKPAASKPAEKAEKHAKAKDKKSK
jgi:putative FmdB family regulatory protein